MFHNFYSCKKSAAQATKKDPTGSPVKKERMKILGRAMSKEAAQKQMAENPKLKNISGMTIQEFTYKKGKNAGKTGYIIVRK